MAVVETLRWFAGGADADADAPLHSTLGGKWRVLCVVNYLGLTKIINSLQVRIRKR
jgi:hypothetical protein